MQSEGLPSTEWQMGKNKIFLRGSVSEPLEDKRLFLINKAATKIQKTWKCQRQRRKYVEIRVATIKIQESYMTWKLRILFLKKRRAAVVIQVNKRLTKLKQPRPKGKHFIMSTEFDENLSQ